MACEEGKLFKLLLNGNRRADEHLHGSSARRMLRRKKPMVEGRFRRWGFLALIIVCGIILLPVLLVASLALLSPHVRQKVKLALVSW